MTRNLTRAYFDQSTSYYSESKDTLILIADMAQIHAANAARRLLMDAAIWRSETGVAKYETTWMINTKLWQALVARAQDKADPAVSTYRDVSGDIWVRNSGGGWRTDEDEDQADIELMPLSEVAKRWGPMTPYTMS